MLKLSLSLVTNTRHLYSRCKQVWFVLSHFLHGLEKQIKTLLKARLQSHTKVNLHQTILRSFEEADDSSLSYILFFFTGEPVHNNFSICYYFCITFPMSRLWWNECFTNQYKPGQWQQQLKSYTLRAPNGLTLQFPPQREIGRTEVGIIKTTSLGEQGPFFIQHWLPPIPQTRPFSPGALPSSAPLKMEACFPLNKLLHPLVCLWGVLYHVSFSTSSGSQVCAFCVRKWGCEYTSGCLPNHWRMCNGFPVILLP